MLIKFIDSNLLKIYNKMMHLLYIFNEFLNMYKLMKIYKSCRTEEILKSKYQTQKK